MTARLGIGIITYNRKDLVRQCVENIRLFTRCPFELVVADDGSQDGTPALLQEMRVPFITGDNRGIAWNRNRALWWLKEEKQCDVIVLFEDDCRPCAYGWEKEWVQATVAYGHINHMPEITLQIDNDISSGAGTADDPFIAPMHQAFCVGYHARALEFVGYLDVRFEKYGEEHVEHTHRFLRAGYGGLLQFRTPERGQVFYVRGGLETLPSETTGTPDYVRQNVALHKAIQEEPLYRAPWRNDPQMFLFREEMEDARRRERLPVPGMLMPERVADARLKEQRGFDAVVSLGGTECISRYLAESFGTVGSDVFDGFITPFHSLVRLFETGFRDLFSTVCLYRYHEALRCRDSLLIYHNCLDIPPGEDVTVEMFHAQLMRLHQEYEFKLGALDRLCDGSKRVLFVRDWRDTLHFEGMHRPSHTATPDFRRLVQAIQTRYPLLDFCILFSNYGDAAMADRHMIFANIPVPDVCEQSRIRTAWREEMTRLGLFLRDECKDVQEGA